MLLGIFTVAAQVPEFESGAVVSIGMPVSSDMLYQRADIKYDVKFHNDTTVVYRLKDTTGDWVYVSGDGKILVASTAKFDFASMDNLKSELNDAINFIKSTGAEISDTAKNSALDNADYYANENGIYHRLKYPFKGNTEIYLVVPNSTIDAARFTIDGTSYYDEYGKDHGHFYSINDEEITSCGAIDGKGHCSVPQVDITDRLLEGTYKISSDFVHEDEHMTMYIETITASKPERPFILHDEDFGIWITETTNSFGLESLREATYLDI